MMKKKILALSVATLLGGFASASMASVIVGTGAGLTATGATDLAFSGDGIGHALVVPYYSVQSGNQTLINLVNTDTVNGKAVKVRFRGAQNSDDVFDFQVYLSPGDVWAANVSQGADGRATLTTDDNSCTLPANVSQAFITDRLSGDAAQKAAGTREGYVEIFNMADIPSNSATNSLYAAIKHNASGNVTCGTALTNLSTDITTQSAAGAAGFDTPTSGLMANWTIINVPTAAAWTGSAAALVATGGNGRGNFVWFPQIADSAAAVAAASTADPLIVGGLDAAGVAVAAGEIAAGFYDLPDMSTPYTGVISPAEQASNLTRALAVASISNEFLTDSSINAATDWVFSMPTRRYSVAVDYVNNVGGVNVPRLVFNAAVADDQTDAGTIAASRWFRPGNVTISGSSACVELGTGAVRVTDRSERTQTTGFVISPGTPTALQFCGETTVLGFNGTSVLGATVATKNIETSGYVDGWARISTLNNAGGANRGLPVLGQAFVEVVHPSVAAGTAGNFGGSWDHRYTRP